MRYLLLFILLFFAYQIRVKDLDKHGIFTDEKFSLFNSSKIWPGAYNQPEIRLQKYFTPEDYWKPKPFRDFFESIAHSDFGTHIIYNFCLHGWMKAFGNHDYQLRIMSVIMAIVLILLLFQFSLRWLNSSVVAFFVSVIVVLDPLNIYLSQVARSYMLSMLLVLSSTWVFLKIVSCKDKVNLGLVLVYAVLAALGFLNHYLNILVSAAHALAFLFVSDKKKLWLPFLGAAALVGSVICWWLTLGGGYLAFDFLEDKNKVHLDIARQAQTQNITATIMLSLPDIILKKSLLLFFDSNILTFDLYNSFKGVKNILLGIIAGASLATAFFFFEKPAFRYIFGILGLAISIYIHAFWINIFLLLAYFTINLHSFQAIRRFYISKNENSFLILIISILVVVIYMLFMIQDALKSGHTTSMSHRYLANMYPFMAILLGFGIHQMLKRSTIYLGILLFVVLTQRNVVQAEWQRIASDESRYNFFSPERYQNPYIEIAEKIKKMAIPGDTLLIPSNRVDVYSVRNKDNSISYEDVQMINLYLPKDSKLQERILVESKDIFYLKHKNGTSTPLFDLRGSLYRY